MGQPTVPDHEIASPRRHLDDAVSSYIDGNVEHRTGMSVQVAIEVSEDRGNTLKAALSAGSVRQEEHPLIGGRARGPQVEIPMQHALVDVIRMALGLRYLEDPAVHRDPQFLGPPDLRKGVVQGWPLPYVPKRLRVVHGDDAPHERLVPVPGLGSVQVRADEGADD